MAINNFTINTVRINSLREIEAGSGAVIAFEQNVLYQYSGGNATIIVFEQNVKAKGSGAVVSFAQNVES